MNTIFYKQLQTLWLHVPWNAELYLYVNSRRFNAADLTFYISIVKDRVKDEILAIPLGIAVWYCHQGIIGHQQLSDTVGFYGVFLHTRESRQFRRGREVLSPQMPFYSP